MILLLNRISLLQDKFRTHICIQVLHLNKDCYFQLQKLFPSVLLVTLKMEWASLAQKECFKGTSKHLVNTNKYYLNIGSS